MFRQIQSAVFAIVLATAGSSAAWANLVPLATYEFQNTLSANQGGVAPLTAVDPLGQSGFQTATLYGQTRQV